jgi:Cu-Zn family superoxide dismutase
MKHARHILAAFLALALLSVAATVALARDHDHGKGKGKSADRVFTLAPDPAGNPEGIAFDKRSKAFYVSITNGGAIYRGTLDSDTVAPFIEGGAGKAAIGVKVRSGLLYVAGGPTGAITVYDLSTKQPVATFSTGPGGFLNDLVVTRRGDIYVTDSFRPTLWRVTAEQVRAGSGTPQALALTPGIAYGTGFNVNGIVDKGRGRLVVVQTNTGKLFRIQLAAGGAAIAAIDEITGVSVPGGDGLLLDRGRLVVVQGGPPAQLSFVKLRDRTRTGTLTGTRTSDKLRGPSTVDRARGLYLVVNADFATSTKPFTVAGLPARGARDEGGHKSRNR